MRNAPGVIRDVIKGYLEQQPGDASLNEITAAVSASVGSVATSSVRSSLRLHSDTVFERTGMGRYRLRDADPPQFKRQFEPAFQHGRALLYDADCFAWLEAQDPSSIHAVVTDPPYSVVDYSPKEIEKMRNGSGGLWRIPPSFDGAKRAPLPRFTVLGWQEKVALENFFKRFSQLVTKALVPGGNVIVASNPLLSHLVASALEKGGLEPRGYLARLTMTMRGGDRPKNAHEEFADVSVMPRSQWEPWIVMRKPLEGRVQDNLRNYGTGGFRRNADGPFGDVIRSAPTRATERALAPHPSLKPQTFLRQVIRASLPLGKGVILDPFAGSGSTLAAANHVGYESIGVEKDHAFVEMARSAIPRLASI